MNPRKLLILTGVVLALFAFIIFFERRMPTTEERQRKGPLHWELPADRVDSVRLERQDSAVELKKTDTGAWRVVKPESYPADALQAMDLVKELASLKRAGGSTDGAQAEPYGLKQPSAKATFTWTEDSAPLKKKTRTVEFGIEIPGGQNVAAARVAGTEAVIFVPSSVLAVVKKNVNDFKSHEVFGGSAADVAMIDIERGRGHLVLAKKGATWWLQQPVSDLADSAVVTRLAGDLVGLRVLDFVGSADKENLATQGLNPPLSRVSLVDAKGVRSTADFGATRSDNNSLYARREMQVLTVPNTIVDELSREVDAFREPHLVSPDRSTVSGLEGQFGETRLALVKSGAGWTAAGKTVPGPAAEDVLSAVLDFKSKSFLDDSDVATLPAMTPVATIRVTSASEPWEIKLYPVKNEFNAVVTRRPGGFLVPGDALTRVEGAFRKALSSQPTPASSQPTPVPSPEATPKKK